MTEVVESGLALLIWFPGFERSAVVLGVLLHWRDAELRLEPQTTPAEQRLICPPPSHRPRVRTVIGLTPPPHNIASCAPSSPRPAHTRPPHPPPPANATLLDVRARARWAADGTRCVSRYVAMLPEACVAVHARLAQLLRGEASFATENVAVAAAAFIGAHAEAALLFVRSCTRLQPPSERRVCYYSRVKAPPRRTGERKRS